MKKIFTLLFALSSLVALSQGPVIEGTYFPVRNTSIKQIWDTTAGVINVPSTGPNQIWDYTTTNGQFIHVCDTFKIKVYDPATAPYHQYFPGAAFAIFMRSPMPNDSFDSLYLYFHADHQNGLSRMGGFNITNLYDSTMILSPRQFFAPPLMSYGFTKIDTSRGVTYVKNYMGLNGKIKSRRIVNMKYIGYGTLKLPNHTYNNVAQIRESYSQLDSIFVDLFGNGNYTFYTTKTSSGKVYNFYRNNTFGSTYLMYLNVNPANTVVEQGWYTLPVDFGSISGKVFKDAAETIPVTSGEMYLYRENSNFAKNDILAKTNLDASGNYQFDSIPYGEYRIAVRPDTALYPNSLITYYGDTTNWIDASTIITTTITSPNHKIHLHYGPAPVGSNNIVGNIGLNLSIMRTNNSAAVNPVKGVGVVIKKNPGSSAERVLVTDNNGDFNTGNLNDGSYRLFVDIPGMHMTGTYNFTVLNGSVVNSLDFTVGTDSIHPNNQSVIGIKENKKSSADIMNAYPNPYSSFATIVVNNPETSKVLLEVYNMLGEKIQTLDNSQKQPGTYKYAFSAKTLNQPTGMYFVKLSAGNKTTVIKLIEQ